MGELKLPHIPSSCQRHKNNAPSPNAYQALLDVTIYAIIISNQYQFKRLPGTPPPAICP